MAKMKFARLKALMFEMGIRQIDLEPIIGRKVAYISTRMRGKAPWNTAEMKAIGELLDIPKDQWLDYFMEDEPERVSSKRPAPERSSRPGPSVESKFIPRT